MSNDEQTMSSIADSHAEGTQACAGTYGDCPSYDREGDAWVTSRQLAQTTPCARKPGRSGAYRETHDPQSGRTRPERVNGSLCV